MVVLLQINYCFILMPFDVVVVGFCDKFVILTIVQLKQFIALICDTNTHRRVFSDFHSFTFIVSSFFLFIFFSLNRNIHWQHCLRTDSADTGFTSIGSTVGRITSPSGGSRICFCDTIR